MWSMNPDPVGVRAFLPDEQQPTAAGAGSVFDIDRTPNTWDVDRTLTLVSAVPEGRDTHGEDLPLIGELLQSALT